MRNFLLNFSSERKSPRLTSSISLFSTNATTLRNFSNVAVFSGCWLVYFSDFLRASFSLCDFFRANPCPWLFELLIFGCVGRIIAVGWLVACAWVWFGSGCQEVGRPGHGEETSNRNVDISTSFDVLKC